MTFDTNNTMSAMSATFATAGRGSRRVRDVALVALLAWASAACHGTRKGGIAPAAVAPAGPATPAALAPGGGPASYTLTPLDGSRLTATVVEVRIEPGQQSRAHSHPCPVVGYVIEGAYRMQVRGEAEHVYTAGQTFYEPANGVHAVSASANDKPVRFLAYFTCDHQTPLTVPPPDSGRSPRD